MQCRETLSPVIRLGVTVTRITHLNTTVDQVSPSKNSVPWWHWPPQLDKAPNHTPDETASEALIASALLGVTNNDRQLGRGIVAADSQCCDMYHLRKMELMVSTNANQVLVLGWC